MHSSNLSAIILVAVMLAISNLPIIRGQMNVYNELYDAQAAYCQSRGSYGMPNDCGSGTRNQNWFGSYYLGQANPYGFVSTMPYGYGSGAQPFYADKNAGGWPGTSFAPGGYIASALMQNNDYIRNPYYRY